MDTAQIACQSRTVLDRQSPMFGMYRGNLRSLPRINGQRSTGRRYQPSGAATGSPSRADAE